MIEFKFFIRSKLSNGANPRMRSCFVQKLFKFFFLANSTWTYYSELKISDIKQYSCPSVLGSIQTFAD